ncbi:MAG: HEAT repeat domain-containing protein [Phycisphaerae bacterium]|nr:HEAT repeat domain-containing protein [Phycisphaerae bacterium]
MSRPPIILALLLAVPFVSGCIGFSGVEPEALETRALERLEQSLNAEDIFVRMKTIESCAKLGLPNAPKICIRAISSGVPSLEFAGAMGLIEMPRRDAEPALKKLLSSSDASVRLAAIGALHRLGRTQHSAELIAALESPSPKTRGDALMILGRVGDESAMPAIRRVLETDEVERVQWQAGEALVLLGDEIILPQLQLWENSRNWQLRIFAMELMCQVRDKDLFVADLLAALGDRNQLVQLQAARSLGRLGQQDGFQQAMKYLHPTAPDQRAVAREMGLAMGERQVAQRIVQIRSLAALALGEIGNWDAAAALAQAVDDRDPQVALAAAHASLRLLQKQ